MRPNPLFASEDPGLVRELIRENPWAVLVSENDGELVASHYPVLLDEVAPELAILTHLGRPDEEVHGLAVGEVLVIVQGRHGYISPGWYPPSPRNVPAWNFTVAHCYAVPEVLDEAENLAVLERLVDRFEPERERPFSLDPERAAEIARGTVGLRLPVSRFICKRKLSQNKDEQTRRAVTRALREPGPYNHPELAAEMERP
jgi:transcriptional regulator